MNAHLIDSIVGTRCVIRIYCTAIWVMVLGGGGQCVCSFSKTRNIYYNASSTNNVKYSRHTSSCFSTACSTSSTDEHGTVVRTRRKLVTNLRFNSEKMRPYYYCKCILVYCLHQIQKVVHECLSFKVAKQLRK